MLTFGFTFTFITAVLLSTFTWFTFNLLYYCWAYPFKRSLVQSVWLNGEGFKQNFGRVTLQQKVDEQIIPAVFVVISKTSLFSCQPSYYSLLQGCFCYNKRFSMANLKIKRGTGDVCVVFNPTSSQTQIRIYLVCSQQLQ